MKRCLETMLLLRMLNLAYGQDHIDKAKVPSLGYTKGKMNQVKYYRALTWKFVRRNNNWYAYVTVDVDTPPITSLKNNGIISIDFNAGFLASLRCRSIRKFSKLFSSSLSVNSLYERTNTTKSK